MSSKNEKLVWVAGFQQEDGEPKGLTLERAIDMADVLDSPGWRDIYAYLLKPVLDDAYAEMDTGGLTEMSQRNIDRMTGSCATTSVLRDLPKEIKEAINAYHLPEPDQH